jgi:hypothetical protein
MEICLAAAILAIRAQDVKTTRTTQPLITTGLDDRHFPTVNRDVYLRSARQTSRCNCSNINSYSGGGDGWAATSTRRVRSSGSQFQLRGVRRVAVKRSCSALRAINRSRRHLAAGRRTISVDRRATAVYLKNRLATALLISP